MKNLKVTVNGITYDVQVEEVDDHNKSADEKVFLDQQKETRTNINLSSQQQDLKDLNSVTSPMPGTIVSVNVKGGQKIAKGEVLLILEAMKMENEIIAQRDMQVVKVKVKNGDSVETGEELILYK